MLFTDLQTSIRDRLLWDAYFTDPIRPVKVVNEDALDLLSEWDKAIGKLGACVIVATPQILEAERVDLVQVTIALGITENVVVNRSRTGSQKTAAQLGAKAMALLRGWTPDEDLWAPIRFQRLERVGETEGLDHWELQLLTFTMLDVILHLIGTETGKAIGDETLRPFTASPTAA